MNGNEKIKLLDQYVNADHDNLANICYHYVKHIQPILHELQNGSSGQEGEEWLDLIQSFETYKRAHLNTCLQFHNLTTQLKQWTNPMSSSEPMFHEEEDMLLHRKFEITKENYIPYKPKSHKKSKEKQKETDITVLVEEGCIDSNNKPKSHKKSKEKQKKQQEEQEESIDFNQYLRNDETIKHFIEEDFILATFDCATNKFNHNGTQLTLYEFITKHYTQMSKPLPMYTEFKEYFTECSYLNEAQNQWRPLSEKCSTSTTSIISSVAVENLF